MLYGILGKVGGLATSITQNASSVGFRMKEKAANLVSDRSKDSLTWKTDYPELAEIHKTTGEIPADIAWLFEEGTKTNQTYLTNDTVLIEIVNGDKKAFITLDGKNNEFATTHRWKDGEDNKITLQCDGEKYDIILPFSPEHITLETINQHHKIVSHSGEKLEIISTKKKTTFMTQINLKISPLPQKNG